MRKYSKVISLSLCALLLFFAGCEDDNENRVTDMGKSVSASDLKIKIIQDDYEGSDLNTRSSEAAYSETIDCGEGLCAEITFAEEPGKPQGTRVYGDDKQSISAGDYLIFAYDANGDCVDYLKFKYDGSAIIPQADQSQPAGKPYGFGNNTELVADGTQSYVCVRLVNGVTPDFANGTVKFVQNTSSDMANYFISEVVPANPNFPSSPTLTFIMRRQTTCLRVKFNAIDTGITGKVSLNSNIDLSSMAPYKIAKELVYNRKNAISEVLPENIVRQEANPSFTYNLEDQTPGELTRTSLSEELPFHASVDFYFLGGTPYINPTYFKLTMKEVKDGDVFGVGPVLWFDSQIRQSLGGLSTTEFKANHRYALNVNLKLTKTYNTGDKLPLGYPEMNKYYLWGAYEDVRDGNDNAWGAGSRKRNEEINWFANNSGKDLADFEKDRLGAVTTPTAKSPNDLEARTYLSEQSEVYWDPGFIFAVKASTAGFWTRNTEGRALTAASKGVWLKKWDKVKDLTPIEDQGSSTIYSIREYDTFDPSVRTNPDFFLLPAGGYYLVDSPQSAPFPGFTPMENEKFYYQGETATRMLRNVEKNYSYQYRPYYNIHATSERVLVNTNDRGTYYFAYPCDWDSDETFVAPN